MKTLISLALVAVVVLFINFVVTSEAQAQGYVGIAVSGQTGQRAYAGNNCCSAPIRMVRRVVYRAAPVYQRQPASFSFIFSYNRGWSSTGYTGQYFPYAGSYAGPYNYGYGECGISAYHRAVWNRFWNGQM